MKSVVQAPTSRIEADIVHQQLKSVSAKLQEANLKTPVLADCIVRSMLCSLLGYSVDFAHIHALQLAQKGSITEKRIGYLGCVMFLHEDEELILLLINTILRDLKSANVMENNMALVAAAHLVPKEMSAMLLPTLAEKLTHSKDFIRKKSLVCLEQMACKNPDLAEQVLEAANLALADKDPGVAMAAIQVIKALHEKYPFVEVHCLEGICQIQRQILEQKMPQDYVFRQVPAPWAQMEILRLIRSQFHFQDAENRVFLLSLVVDTLEQPFPNDHSIGQAVIYECIESIGMILKPEDEKYGKILRRLVRYLNGLLESDHGNNIYVGLCAFEGLLSHQKSGILLQVSDSERKNVFQCLDHPDESVQRKAFTLINQLASQDSVQDVCDKILTHLKTVSDDYFKSILIDKTLEMVDNYQIDLDWRIFVLLRLLQRAKNEPQKVKIMTKMQEIFGSKPYSEEKMQVGHKLLNLLERPAQEKDAPETLLELYIWSLANFGHTCDEIIVKTVQIVRNVQFTPTILLPSLRYFFALVTTTNDSEILKQDKLADFLEEAGQKSESNVQIQHLIEELKLCLELVPQIKGSHNDLDLSRDCSMSYLDKIVVQALMNGAPIYDSSSLAVPDVQRSRSPSLRITPYNVMDKSEWKSLSSPKNSELKSNSSTASGSLKPAPPVVWTAHGRVKTEQVQESTEDPSEKCDKSDKDSKIQMSVIQDLKQWS